VVVKEAHARERHDGQGTDPQGSRLGQPDQSPSSSSASTSRASSSWASCSLEMSHYPSATSRILPLTRLFGSSTSCAACQSPGPRRSVHSLPDRQRRYKDDLVRDRYGIVYRLSRTASPTPSTDNPRCVRSRPLGEHEARPARLPDAAVRCRQGRRRGHTSSPYPRRFVGAGVCGERWSISPGLRANPDLAQALARVATDFCNAASRKPSTSAPTSSVWKGPRHNPTTLMSPAHYRRFLEAVSPGDGAWRTREECPSSSTPMVTSGQSSMTWLRWVRRHSPIQPQCMDIGEVKRHLAGRACVLGNIDCMYLLPSGSEKRSRSR